MRGEEHGIQDSRTGQAVSDKWIPFSHASGGVQHSSAAPKEWPAAHKSANTVTAEDLVGRRTVRRGGREDFQPELEILGTTWDDSLPFVGGTSSSQTSLSSSVTKDGLHFDSDDTAITEISLDAIDALAAESAQYVKSTPASHTVAEASPSAATSSTATAARKLRIRREDPRAKFHLSDESWEDRRDQWQIQKSALQDKFQEGWNPRKKLSPDALEGIRAIHAQYPEKYTSEVLAAKFEVSVESIRRILKSKWRPKEAEEADRQLRWYV